MEWTTHIQYVKGVGEKRAALFAKLDIRTVRDLLAHYPRDYEDWSHPLTIGEAPYGKPCCIRAHVTSPVQEYRVRKGLVLYKFTVSDGREGMHITLYNVKYTAEKLGVGTPIYLFGTVSGNFHRREMSAPLIEFNPDADRLRPIYPQTAGLNSHAIEKVVRTAMEALGPLLDADPLPPSVGTGNRLMPRGQALRAVHFPDSRAQAERARARLAFEECLLLQLGLFRLKGRSRGTTAVRILQDHTPDFTAKLPFTLTGAQKRAMAECLADLRSGHPMSRLVQGDVGSGKTAVAAGVAYSLMREGWQAAMMTPTEILAQQHATSLQKLLPDCRVGLLTASLRAPQKREVLAGLADGSIQLVVGTHALLSDKVEFARLGLVITDEQHRFGVAQRAALAAKGTDPHLLVMSATPIPRTLALIIYGDLDVSVLDELPPGRQPVETFAVGTDKRERAYAYVRKHIEAGRQGYVVCPLVEDQEEDENGLPAEAPLASATAFADRLREGALFGCRVGLLHGRLKAADKEAVMAAFAAGEIDVLVATTVIEVGVDVPNAVIMVIENAERFGLAQLHQLRGRVGRGKHKSTCILISDNRGSVTKARLSAMTRTNDGFKIADEDLRLRGPGDFFGNRQHGLPRLKLAALTGDLSLVSQAQDTAAALLETDPLLQLPEHKALAAEVAALFAEVGEHGLN